MAVASQVTLSMDVVLDDPNGIYFAGQTLSGKVKLNTSGDLNIRSLEVILTGQCYVEWVISTEDTESYYTNEETYVNATHHIFHPGPGLLQMIVKAGAYTLPFQFKLPENIASSYEADVGNVRYELLACLNKPFVADAYTTSKRVITMVNTLDLNRVPGLLNKANSQSRPVTFTLELKEKTGYVPGEIIHFESDISNMSDRKINTRVARLIMIVQYYGKGDGGGVLTKTVKNVLEEVRAGPVNSGDTDSWKDGKLRVPSVPSSFLQNCRCIDINYYLQMLVVPSGMASGLKLSTEVVIGNIPLRQSAAPNRTVVPTAPPSEDTNTGINNPSSMPTFVQSTVGWKSTKVQQDPSNTNVAPVYPNKNSVGQDPASHFNVTG